MPHSTRRPRPIRTGNHPLDPILVFCLPAIGDFIRCHSAIQLIAQKFPGHPIDLITSRQAAPLARLMPDVRKAWVLEKRHLQPGIGKRMQLARQLREQDYRACYLLSSSTKAALVPLLAGIPERIGYPRELQFGIVNRLPADWLKSLVAFGPRKTRLFEQVCAIALLGKKPDEGMKLPPPRMTIAPERLSEWRTLNGIDPAKPALTLYNLRLLELPLMAGGAVHLGRRRSPQARLVGVDCRWAARTRVRGVDPRQIA